MINRAIALTGLITGAALVGGGLTAFADQPSSTPTASSPASTATQQHRAGRHHAHGIAAALHGTWVTKGKAGVVTHQAIRGTVTAVGATSITVKAADGVSESFAVTKDTLVAQRAARAAATKAAGAKAAATKAAGTRQKLTTIAIGTVKVGEKAMVTGTGTTAPTAKRIVVAAA